MRRYGIHRQSFQRSETVEQRPLPLADRGIAVDFAFLLAFTVAARLHYCVPVRPDANYSIAGLPLISLKISGCWHLY
jgi:hypothetical protein